jgi:hypothetical protein
MNSFDQRLARLRKSLDGINSGKIIHGSARHGAQDWIGETHAMKAHLETEIEILLTCAAPRRPTR